MSTLRSFTVDEVLELVRRTARRELEAIGAPFPRKSADAIARKVIAGLGLISGAAVDVDEAAAS
jgi:hypothetical protein